MNLVSNDGRLATESVFSAARKPQGWSAIRGALFKNTARVTINTLHLRQHLQPYNKQIRSTFEANHRGNNMKDEKEWWVYQNIENKYISCTPRENYEWWAKRNPKDRQFYLILTRGLTKTQAETMVALTQEE